MLVENRVIEKWILDGGHDRREYSITFQKYEQIYDEIMDRIPFFIRMNMANVDSSQLKTYLLKCTEDVIRKLEKSVYDLVMNKKNEIQNELEHMISTATSKIEDCKTLVKIESQVDGYRRNGIKKLQDKNIDLVKWIGITLYNTFYVVTGEDLTLLRDTSAFLHRIYERLDKQDTFIFQQRKKLEIQAA